MRRVSIEALAVGVNRGVHAGFRALAAGVVSLLALTPASGGTINYGNFLGATVQFDAITEENVSTDPVPLYGPPTVNGDSVSFSPTRFSSSSAEGETDETAGNLFFGVDALSGNGIAWVSFSESGTTTLSGLATPGSMTTGSSVVAEGSIVIHEVDFAAIEPLSVPFSLSFGPSGGTYFLGTDGGGGPLFSTPWSGSVKLDLAALLTANGVSFDEGATRITVDLDNALETASQIGTSATINKDSVVINFGQSVDVPEPSSLALSALALTVLLLRRRRVVA